MAEVRLWLTFPIPAWVILVIVGAAIFWEQVNDSSDGSVKSFSRGYCIDRGGLDARWSGGDGLYDSNLGANNVIRCRDGSRIARLP